MANLTLPQRLRTLFTGRIPNAKTRPVNALSYSQSAIDNGNYDVDTIHQAIISSRNGNIRELLDLYYQILMSDSHLQGELSKRKLAVLNQVFTCQPGDKNNSKDVKLAEEIARQINGVPGFLHASSHLLDSTLWPVSVVEKVFTPGVNGNRYELSGLIPVPHILLDYTTGSLRIRDVDERTGYPMGTHHLPDPERYIVHRGHLLTTPDTWGGPMRSLVFWWLFSTQDREWWARFLDRFGAPFLVGKYSQDDDQSRITLANAFSAATKLFGIVVSTETEIEVQQASSTSNGDAFEKFHGVAQKEKSKLILGQTLSAEAQSTGLGSGVSKEQGEVRDDIRQFDGRLLCETLKSQLVAQILRINGWDGIVKPVWSMESSAAASSTGDLLEKLANAGLRPSQDSLPTLSERVGFTLERVQAPGAPTGGLSALSANPSQVESELDRLAATASPDLARALRGTFAPIRRIVLTSRSAQECEERVRAFYADWSPSKCSAVVEEALIAYTANGASNLPKT